MVELRVRRADLRYQLIPNIKQIQMFLHCYSWYIKGLDTSRCEVKIHYELSIH